MYGPYNHLTVEKLRELLAEVDGNYLIMTNKVGNLAINDPNGSYCGYIDFALEVVDMLDDEEEE